MRKTTALTVFLACAWALAGCGDAEPPAAGTGTQASPPPAGPRLPTVRLLWPPHAEASERGADGAQGTLRMHVAPGRTQEGSLVEVRSVHLVGPPGVELAVQKARVLPTEAGWHATRTADGASLVLYAGEGAAALPAEGLTVVLEGEADTLGRAVFRDVTARFRRDAAREVTHGADDALVGTLYTGGDPALDKAHGYALRLPFASD